jgi:hypothetical protein
VDEYLGRIATAYRRFARHEAHGRSPLYEQLASEVARDQPTLEFLSELPRPKQQPNLLFGSLRYVCGTTPDSWKDFRDWLNVNREQIRQIMLNRRTQTNEPARCATLLPLLALLPQPLALLEIGASAVNDVLVEDKAENESSLKYGFRLMSSYQITETKKLWVITEGDRSVTTLLLPAEY